MTAHLHAVPDPTPEQLAALDADPDAPLDLDPPTETTALAGPTGWRADAACHGLDPALFFPERDDGRDNHGRAAKAVCATCPVVERCLIDALERGEDQGIWGGAGESLRRWLARAWRTGGARWQGALDSHLATLHGEHRPVVDRNGTGATHGVRSTYNRGCRCRPCRLSVSLADLTVEPLDGGGTPASKDDVEWRPLSSVLSPFTSERPA